MTSKFEIINELEATIKLLSLEKKFDEQNEKLFLRIENEIGVEIPNEIKKLVSVINRLDQKVSFFLGFDPIDTEKLNWQYENKKDECSFFGAYLIDDHFIAAPGRLIGLYDNQNGVLEEEIEITDVRKLVPLFMFGADYIVVNLSEKSQGELVLIGDGYSANILAPNLNEHLQDLLDGVKTEVYEVLGDLDINYPASWQKRQKVRSGEYYVDEDGDILKKTLE